MYCCGWRWPHAEQYLYSVAFACLQGYHNYIDEGMPPESPYLYGLHPNAEIGFLTTTSEKLFRTVFEMQPRDAAAGGGTTVTREDKVLDAGMLGEESPRPTTHPCTRQLLGVCR